MGSQAGRGLAQLVLLNVALQVFDGVATYLGLRAGFGEANPLIASMVGAVGPGSALLLVKLEACACVLAVWHLGRSRLAAPALTLTAVTYAIFSVAPWAAALMRAHFDS
jgi:uncharacterized membrane protein